MLFMVLRYFQRIKKERRFSVSMAIVCRLDFPTYFTSYFLEACCNTGKKLANQKTLTKIAKSA